MSKTDQRIVLKEAYPYTYQLAKTNIVSITCRSLVFFAVGVAAWLLTSLSTWQVFPLILSGIIGYLIRHFERYYYSFDDHGILRKPAGTGRGSRGATMIIRAEQIESWNRLTWGRLPALEIILKEGYSQFLVYEPISLDDSSLLQAFEWLERQVQANRQQFC